MIRLRPAAERGHADHGWLDTFHTFSFASYRDPEHVRYGPLRVLNQDRVAPGAGFATHGHENMEIVSVVLDGVLEHRDSMGHGSRMIPGEVQLMSAGSGVTHSEFNGSSTESLHFLQMWIFPRRKDGEPRYEQRAFPAEERRGRLRLVVSPDGRDQSLTIDQDACLHLATLRPEDTIEVPRDPARGAWLHVATGSVDLDGTRLVAGDGAAIEEVSGFTLSGVRDSEVVLWDLPLGR